MKKLIIGLAVVGLLGCSSTPKSTMQVRQAQTKMIDGGYENVFRATMTVLQDNDYVIKQTDMNSGLIVAQVNRETSGGAQLMSALFLGTIAHKNTVIEVSTTLNKINDSSQELRMNIQEVAYAGNGSINTIKQIDKPEVYTKLFNDIAVEVKRREALGRS